MTAGRLRTGLLLILVGVVLLLNTTGLVEWNLWENLLTLWPIFLIAIGIEKIFAASERLKSFAYISPLVIVATFAYAVVAGTQDDGSSWRDDGDNGTFEWFTAATPTAKRVKMSADFGSGRLVVSDGATADHLAEGRFTHRGRKPRIETAQADSVLTIQLSRTEGVKRHRTIGSRDRERWIIKLSDKLPIDLSLDAGGAQLGLELTNLPVERLGLSAGAADIDLSLGSKSPMVDCGIDCGAASIDVTIPASAGLRISGTSALSTFSSGPLDLIEQGEYMETPDYESRAVKIVLRVESGASSLRIHVADGNQASASF